MLAAYLPASAALELARSRTRRAAAAAGLDDRPLAGDWLMPSMRENFAMVSPMLVPVFNLVLR